MDLAPTITELDRARRRAWRWTAAHSSPSPQNPAAGAAREILFESEVNGGSAGVRSGQWVFIDNENGEPELYDLSTDPFQLENLAALPGFAAKRAELQAKVDIYRTCAGGSCP